VAVCLCKAPPHLNLASNLASETLHLTIAHTSDHIALRMLNAVYHHRRFISNTASVNGGGGVYVFTLQTMTVNNVTFLNNTATIAGGALETVCWQNVH